MVVRFAADLPTIKLAYLAELDREVAQTKQERTCVARQSTGGTTVEAQIYRSLLAPTVTRSDPSGDPAQHRQIAALDAAVIRLYAMKKAAVADDLWRPDRPPLAGQLAGERAAGVSAVPIWIVGPHDVIVVAGGTCYWLVGTPTHVDSCVEVPADDCGPPGCDPCRRPVYRHVRVPVVEWQPFDVGPFLVAAADVKP